MEERKVKKGGWTKHTHVHFRWGDYTVARPNNDQHLAKLLRRLKTFLSESFVEARDSHDGWKVCLEKII